MKANRYKYHHASVPLYQGDLHVLVAHNFTDAYRLAGFGAAVVVGKEPDAWGALAWDDDRGDHYAVFCLFRPDATAGQCAHEAVHVVNFLLKRAGIRLDPDNDEPQAYLMGWVADQIHHALTSKTVKAKKSFALK